MSEPFYYPIFAIDDPVELNVMLAAAGLGTLITRGQGAFTVTHIPFFFDPEARVLRGHVSFRNPHSAIEEFEALVLFGGPDAYVSPGFYPSKAVHGRVAPTWNYEFLHVHGPVRWIHDPLWLRRNLDELTNRHEADREDAWRVDDAPEDFTQAMLGQIVGVEVSVARVEGRRKFSQNERVSNRRGVIAGLAASADLASQRMAGAMARLETDDSQA